MVYDSVLNTNINDPNNTNNNDVPYLLTQEATNELTELITCPPQEDINALISIKNKLVKQLNISYTSIQKSSKLLSINDEIVVGLDAAYKVLKFLPVPTAIAGVGIPISVVNNVQDAKDFLKSLKGKLSSTNTGITSVINPLEDILTISQMLYDEAGKESHGALETYIGDYMTGVSKLKWKLESCK